MRLFKSEFPAGEFRKHERMVSGLVKTLGRVRDCDVNIIAERKFRKTLSADDGKAVSVLLIRDNATRRARIKLLAREVKGLRSAKYDKAALRFFDSLPDNTAPKARSKTGGAAMREQTRKLIPSMFQVLTEHAEQVIADPAAIDELHKMRLAGKPLRYLMEVSAQMFGEPFRACLAEIKSFLDIAGTIHDCDVLIGVLEDFLKFWDGPEPRRNKLWRTTSRAGIVRFIRHERALRRRKFAALTRMVTRWRKEDFGRKLLKSAALPAPAPALQFKPAAGGRPSLFLAES
jgi:CHAD domain-containing protein